MRVDSFTGKTQFTCMNMFTKVSGKGQVVLPKAMRDKKAWHAGTDLEVVDAGEGVLLRPRTPTRKLTLDEATAKLRRIYTHEGPAVPIEQLGWHLESDERS